jgi:hypothetical protein
VFLRAYFDESSREGGTYAVAGYAFLPEEAREFDESWRAMLGSVKTFHMTDVANLRGEFKEFTPGRRDAMLRRAVEIVNERFAIGVAASCSRQEFEQVAPPDLPYHRHPYPMLCYLCTLQVGVLLDAHHLRGEVEYFFEAGNEHQAAAEGMMDYVIRDPEVKLICRHQSHAFIDKECATPLQAADLLAWEWAKFHEETVTKSVREIRKSLVALVDRKSPRYRFMHPTGERLGRYLQELKDKGIFADASQG